MSSRQKPTLLHRNLRALSVGSRKALLFLPVKGVQDVPLRTDLSQGCVLGREVERFVIDDGTWAVWITNQPPRIHSIAVCVHHVNRLAGQWRPSFKVGARRLLQPHLSTLVTAAQARRRLPKSKTDKLRVQSQLPAFLMGKSLTSSTLLQAAAGLGRTRRAIAHETRILPALLFVLGLR